MTQQKKRRLGLAVPESMHKKISEQSKYQGKTINATCLDIFWSYFEDKSKTTKANMVRE